jgi:adenine-specific DNA-methyltransferase
MKANGTWIGSSARSEAEKRALGIFYTPTELSELVCAWAVRGKADRLLEPSFGGCIFLRTAAANLRRLGCRAPVQQIYGCDVDATAFQHLRTSFPRGYERDNFLKIDFLRTDENTFPKVRFDAVIGNPPYVSRHNMTADQREIAEAIADPIARPSRTASLWAYFVSHSLRFLRDGGRVGWVLPGSMSSTHYGRTLLGDLTDHFADLKVITLTERFFEGEAAQESTTLLLADGFTRLRRTGRRHEMHAPDLEACRKLVRGQPVDRNKTASARPVSLDLLSKIPGICPFGELANIRIGVVTGDNKFFLMNETLRCERSLPKGAFVRVVPRLSRFEGLELVAGDHEQLIENGENGWLLNATAFEHEPPVAKYLGSYPDKARRLNATFKKRRPWHATQLGETADAFLSYMNADQPRLVGNRTRLQVPNNTHRIYFKPHVTTSMRKLAMISFASSLTALSAELAGRSYGSGVLKLEPSEARRLLVALPSVSDATVDRAFEMIDRHFREGNCAEARAAADKFLTLHCPALQARYTQTQLAAMAAELRLRRIPERQVPMA